MVAVVSSQILPPAKHIYATVLYLELIRTIQHGCIVGFTFIGVPIFCVGNAIKVFDLCQVSIQDSIPACIYLLHADHIRRVGNKHTCKNFRTVICCVVCTFLHKRICKQIGRHHSCCCTACDRTGFCQQSVFEVLANSKRNLLSVEHIFTQIGNGIFCRAGAACIDPENALTYGNGVFHNTPPMSKPVGITKQDLIACTVRIAVGYDRQILTILFKDLCL